MAPGTGKVKTGYLWAIARDDGAHGGTDPPAVVYTYMPGRGKVWAEKLLGDFTGVVQCDGYGAYKHIEASDRKGGPGTLAFCWAHVRRGFFDDAKGGTAPVAEEALRRITSLYRIEARIRGSSAEHRLAVRQAESASIIADMRPWLEEMLPRLPRSSNTAEAISYTLNPGKASSASSKMGGSSWTTIPSSDQSGRLPSSEKMPCSQAMTSELKTGRPLPASSKPANWAASTRRPTSPMSSPVSFCAAT